MICTGDVGGGCRPDEVRDAREGDLGQDCCSGFWDITSRGSLGARFCSVPVLGWLGWPGDVRIWLMDTYRTRPSSRPTTLTLPTHPSSPLASRRSTSEESEKSQRQGRTAGGGGDWLAGSLVAAGLYKLAGKQCSMYVWVG